MASEICQHKTTTERQEVHTTTFIVKAGIAKKKENFQRYSQVFQGEKKPIVFSRSGKCVEKYFFEDVGAVEGDTGPWDNSTMGFTKAKIRQANQTDSFSSSEELRCYFCNLPLTAQKSSPYSNMFRTLMRFSFIYTMFNTVTSRRIDENVVHSNRNPATNTSADFVSTYKNRYQTNVIRDKSKINEKNCYCCCHNYRQATKIITTTAADNVEKNTNAYCRRDFRNSKSGLLCHFNSNSSRIYEAKISTFNEYDNDKSKIDCFHREDGSSRQYEGERRICEKKTIMKDDKREAVRIVTAKKPNSTIPSLLLELLILLTRFKDLQTFLRIFLPIVFLFNMLSPVYTAASYHDASLHGPNPQEPRSWIPVVAYLEPLPRTTTQTPTPLPKCDQTFVSRTGGPQNGTFSAPSLQIPTNHSRQCLYIFLAGPKQRVEVVFTAFNLRGTPPDGAAVGELPACVHEYMDIYAEVQSSDPADLINSPFGGRYCGQIPPRRRISMFRAIALSFYTNKNSTTHELFQGRYSFINASEYEIGSPIAGAPCSYTVTPSTSTNKTGALISPTYPGAYPKDMSCTYQFVGEPNQRVRLEFRDFDLFFGGMHCPFDYVRIYDGPDNSSALIGTYCGQQRNLVLYSSESSLFVHFFTLKRTANTQNRGFKGIYEFSESFVQLEFIRQNDGIHIRGSECDQKILSKKESTGHVVSPNYPYPYIPKTVCRYFIYGMQDAQHLERVRLEFSIFEIPRVEHKDKGESNCTDGYLKVYLKGQETMDAYDKFDYELCGNETSSVVSDGPRLALVFSSGELQGRGFKAKYTFETEYKIPGTAAPDGSCSFTYRSTSRKKGELNSPRYPSNYPSDTNCSYLFLATPNEQVTIVFDHFKVKADNVNTTGGAYGISACFEDWLEIYVIYRDGPDRYLGRYCGQTAPGPVESPKGAVGLKLFLHTDSESVASGFKARYIFEAAKSEFGDCGGNYSGQDSGIITSQNYPANYKGPGKGLASNACNWYIVARIGYRISINIEIFSVEGEPATRGCPAAVLRIWTNLESDTAPIELCGDKSAIEHWYYTSQGQSARISFTTTDKTVGAQGFRIVWTEIQDAGPGPPSPIAPSCETTYHFKCNSGFCIADKLRCDGTKNCGPGDDSDEMHCIVEAPKEDHGVLIICSMAAGSFLICLLCTVCHRKRKRRVPGGTHNHNHHNHNFGLHRSSTAASGLSSSRRQLQGLGTSGTSGNSLSGSLHAINTGLIPPAPLPPTSVPPPPHVCMVGGVLGGVLGGLGGVSGMLNNGIGLAGLEVDDDDDDEDDNEELFINDVHFDDDDEDQIVDNMNGECV